VMQLRLPPRWRQLEDFRFGGLVEPPLFTVVRLVLN
jgi:hypothetical protein